MQIFCKKWYMTFDIWNYKILFIRDDFCPSPAAQKDTQFVFCTSLLAFLFGILSGSSPPHDRFQGCFWLSGVRSDGKPWLLAYFTKYSRSEVDECKSRMTARMYPTVAQEPHTIHLKRRVTNAWARTTSFHESARNACFAYMFYWYF